MGVGLKAAVLDLYASKAQPDASPFFHTQDGRNETRLLTNSGCRPMPSPSSGGLSYVLKCRMHVSFRVHRVFMRHVRSHLHRRRNTTIRTANFLAVYQKSAAENSKTSCSRCHVICVRDTVKNQVSCCSGFALANASGVSTAPQCPICGSRTER